MRWALRGKKTAGGFSRGRNGVSKNNMYDPCGKHKDVFITVVEGVGYELHGRTSALFRKAVLQWALLFLDCIFFTVA